MSKESKELSIVSSFKDYLRSYFDANILEFRLAIKGVDDETDEVLIMVHPMNVNGTTLDLVVNGDELFFEDTDNDENNDETEDTPLNKLATNEDEF